MAVMERLRAPWRARRLTRVIAPPPEARPQEGETLAERYSRMAHEGWRPARVDLALRTADIVIGGTALVVLAPVLLAVWVLERLRAPLADAYRGVRAGKAGRT